MRHSDGAAERRGTGFSTEYRLDKAEKAIVRLVEQMEGYEAAVSFLTRELANVNKQIARMRDVSEGDGR